MLQHSLCCVFRWHADPLVQRQVVDDFTAMHHLLVLKGVGFHPKSYLKPQAGGKGEA